MTERHVRVIALDYGGTISAQSVGLRVVPTRHEQHLPYWQAVSCLITETDRSGA